MSFSGKLTVRFILVLLLLVCLIPACKEAGNTATNQNTTQGAPQTGSAANASDITGESEIKKRTPETVKNTAASPTPKSQTTQQPTPAKTPQVEPSTNTERVDNSANKTEPTSSPVRYILGPQGRCFFLNEAGKRIYVDRSMCLKGADPNVSRRPPPPQTPNSPEYILGPRGNCFYMNSAGVKVFVPKIKCGR